MAFRGTQRRRVLEDLFQAGAVLAAGALLFWSSYLLQDETPALFPPTALRSLTGLQTAAGLAAGWAGLLVLVWWGVGVAAALLSALLLRSGNRRAARAVGRFSPLFLRRLSAAALGVQLAAAPLPVLAAPDGSTGPAGTVSARTVSVNAASVSAASVAADPAGTGPYGAPSYGAPVSGSPAADPGWHPSGSTGSSGAGSGSAERGSAVAHSSGRAADPSWKPSPGPVDSSLLIPGTREQAGAAATVTVRAGDTLWDLAAAQLGSLATDYEVAGHWPAWHQKNRSVIGPDPHHLLPGQVLAVPPLPAG